MEPSLVKWTSPGIEKVQVETFFFQSVCVVNNDAVLCHIFLHWSECEELELSALTHTSDAVNLVNISFVVAHACQARD